MTTSLEGAVRRRRRIFNPVQNDAVTFLETSEESGGGRTSAELDVAPGGKVTPHNRLSSTESFRGHGRGTDGAAPGRPGEVSAGTWLHNPATGEVARLRVGPADTDGRRIEVDLWLQPGAAVAGPHRHAHVVERFEVLAGRVAFRIGDTERHVGRGDGVMEVAPGIVHDWWNAGDGTARVRVEVEAPAGAPGRPAARFVGVIEALWSLGALGRVNAEGMPDLLWLAAIGHEYRDAIRFTRPPAVVQAALFAPLAALARRTGRDPLAPELHGPLARCVIADPGEDGLARLLARRVPTRVARGRG